MPRTRLFQVVDIVPTQKCVLVTFQKADRQLVEDRQFDLEAELSDQLASGQASKLFIDITKGLRYGHAYHKQRGKVIKIHNPSQTHLDFVQHADRLLASPPAKAYKHKYVTALANESKPSGSNRRKSLL